jgi:hypothetical protein
MEGVTAVLFAIPCLWICKGILQTLVEDSVTDGLWGSLYPLSIIYECALLGHSSTIQRMDTSMLCRGYRKMKGREGNGKEGKRKGGKVRQGEGRQENGYQGKGRKGREE